MESLVKKEIKMRNNEKWAERKEKFKQGLKKTGSIIANTASTLNRGVVATVKWAGKEAKVWSEVVGNKSDNKTKTKIKNNNNMNNNKNYTFGSRNFGSPSIGGALIGINTMPKQQITKHTKPKRKRNMKERRKIVIYT